MRSPWQLAISFQSAIALQIHLHSGKAIALATRHSLSQAIAILLLL
jgi:hypothetical protein